jgi:hypothetical protein
MARALFTDVDKDIRKDGWIMESPFLPVHIGDGQFIMQMRPRGEVMRDTYSTIVDTFAEVVQVGKS